MDLMYDVVKQELKVKYEDLPSNVVEVVKKALLDTLGCAVAGSPALGLPELVGLVKDWGGKPECSILVYGGKVPAPNAVLANCTMARAQDFDDVHEGRDDKGMGGHVSATFIPTMLALAEYADRPVSGREFILAAALGSDLTIRLRAAVTAKLGWLADTFAPFGVVAGGGRLLGFDEEKMLNGMGIAYSQCSCNRQATADGAMTIRLQQGLGGRAGVTALVLAQKGFTGAKNVLQGAYGLYPLYCRNEYDPAVVTDKLGKEFEIAYVSVKLYPCVKFAHGGIDGALALMRENRLKPELVEEVNVTVNAWAYEAIGGGEVKYRPRTIMDAQFSSAYTVATAILKGDVFIGDFTEKAIKDPKVLDFAKKIKVGVDPELEKLAGMPPTTVEIKTRDGKRYSKRVECVKGHPKNPMSMAEMIKKFRKCLAFSARPLPEANIARVVEMAQGLEKVKDVREIVKQIA